MQLQRTSWCRRQMVALETVCCWMDEMKQVANLIVFKQLKLSNTSDILHTNLIKSVTDISLVDNRCLLLAGLVIEAIPDATSTDVLVPRMRSACTGTPNSGCTKWNIIRLKLYIPQINSVSSNRISLTLSYNTKSEHKAKYDSKQ